MFFGILATIYTIEMNQDLISSGELLQTSLPAESVPGNTNLNHRLDTNAMTALWAIHEGILERSLFGADNTNSTTRWTASLTNLNAQAASRRLLLPGPNYLATSMPNPTLYVDDFEKFVHNDRSTGCSVWSTSLFDDGAQEWSKAILPASGTYTTNNLENVLRDFDWTNMFSPVQRCSSRWNTSSSYDMVMQQFLANLGACGPVPADAFSQVSLDDWEIIYPKWSRRYAPAKYTSLTSATLSARRNHPSLATLAYLNESIAPLDRLCQYSDESGNPLKVAYNIPTTKTAHSHFWNWEMDAAAAGLFDSATQNPNTGEITVSPQTLSSWTLTTNYYTTATSVYTNSVPVYAVTTHPDSVALELPRAHVSLSVDPATLVSNFWNVAVNNQCDFNVELGSAATAQVVLSATDEGVNRQATIQFSDTSLTNANSRTLRCSAARKYDYEVGNSIATYNADHSSRLLHDGWAPSTPAGTFYTQSAIVTQGGTNADERAVWKLGSVDFNGPSIRNAMRGAWSTLLADLKTQGDSHFGSNPSTPSALIGNVPQGAPPAVRLTGTGNIYLTGAEMATYHTNVNVQVRHPYFGYTVHLLPGMPEEGPDNYTTLNATIDYFNWPGITATPEVYAQWSSHDVGMYFDFRQSTSRRIYSYPSDYPQTQELIDSYNLYKSTFPSAHFFAYEEKALWSSVNYDRPEAGADHREWRHEGTYSEFRSIEILNASESDYISSIIVSSTPTSISSEIEMEFVPYSYSQTHSIVNGTMSSADGRYYINNIELDMSQPVTLAGIDYVLNVTNETTRIIEPQLKSVSGQADMYGIPIYRFPSGYFSNHAAPDSST